MEIIKNNGKVDPEHLPILVEKGVIHTIFLKLGYVFTGKTEEHYDAYRNGNNFFRIKDIASIKCDDVALYTWAKQERAKLNFLSQDEFGRINGIECTHNEYRLMKEKEISDEIQKQELMFKELRGGVTENDSHTSKNQGLQNQ